MRTFRRRGEQLLSLAALVTLCLSHVSARQSQGELQGRVVDTFGAVIVGATATLTDAAGAAKTATTNGEGLFVFRGLAPGSYTLHVGAKGFAVYESAGVRVEAGRHETLDVKLEVEVQSERVDVSETTRQINLNPEDNASATILRGSDLDILSDDPDQLAADLDALAGGADGPNNTQIVVDGFTGARIPPKSSIREIRINSNPFAAEQEFFGFGRAEIITKPGADSVHGSAFFNFNDESLNGRNPYAVNRAPYQARLFGGNVGGPIVAGKASYFFDFEQRRIDENAVVDARVLDGALNVVRFGQTVVTPQRRTNFSARFDYQLNANNTLVGRYNFLGSEFDNNGVGGFSLPSRAFDTLGREHTLRLTETAVLSPKMLNELRLQYTRSRDEREGDNSLPTINVQDAFVGGATLGFNSVATERFELSDTLTRASGAHTWKFGGRVRRVHVSDLTSTNFAGTFVFSSLEQYRQVLLGVPGARPAQFTLAGGEPLANVTQWDSGLFVQDDWRVRPNFILSAGLRYEFQTNINDSLNFGPRLSFAWSPGAGVDKRPKTVIRGGAGIFFDRVEESLVLLALRFNGLNEQQFIVRDPDFFPRVPTVQELAAGSQLPTIRRIVDNAKMPHTLRLAISVERELPLSTKLSVNYIYRADRDYPRSLNVNAPLPGTFDPDISGSGIRPFSGLGNIFEFDTSGKANKHTLLVTVDSRPTKRLTMFGRFVLSRERGDNEDAFSFPANSYDVRSEYGPVSFSILSNANFGVGYTGPWGLAFNSFIRAASANRFNITIGRDINGDAVFTDRPAFATDLTRPSVVVTPYGAFDTDPLPGQQIVPPFYVKGPAFFTWNMRVAKAIRFGDQAAASGAKKGQEPKRYTLTFAVQSQNILNHTNRGPIIGNLSSPLFGRSNSSATPPRRVDLQVRFSF